MKFTFDIGSILAENVSIWERGKLVELNSRNPVKFRNLCEIVDKMGIASASAQALGGVITSASKLLASDHKLYICCFENEIAGILKVGIKKLFISTRAIVQKEINPLCVLDIYVCEPIQRSGIGKRMFEFMLRHERVTPEKLAYDRPSPKLLAFLAKHYGLRSFSPQANNFVVYDKYFQEPESQLLRPNSSLKKQKSESIASQIRYSASQSGVHPIIKYSAEQSVETQRAKTPKTVTIRDPPLEEITLITPRTPQNMTKPPTPILKNRSTPTNTSSITNPLVPLHVPMDYFKTSNNEYTKSALISSIEDPTKRASFPPTQRYKQFSNRSHILNPLNPPPLEVSKKGNEVGGITSSPLRRRSDNFAKQFYGGQLFL